MNCQQFTLIREVWRDGELDEAMIQQAQTHLAQCPSCATSWKAESRWLDALGRADEQLVPESRGFAQRVAARREAASAGWWVRMRQSFGWRWAGAAAAAVMIGTMLAVMTAWLNGPGLAEQPEPDPLGMLVRQVENMDWPQPQSLVGGIKKVGRAISLEALSEAMVLPWLDPAPWKNHADPGLVPHANIPTEHG